MGDSQKSLKICATFLNVNYSFHQSSQERQKWLQRVTRETVQPNLHMCQPAALRKLVTI